MKRPNNYKKKFWDEDTVVGCAVLAFGAFLFAWLGFLAWIAYVLVVHFTN